MEALKGKQHKIDKNKNGQIDSHDFKLLRKEEADLFEAGPHDPDFVEKSARHERLYTYHKRMGNDTEAAKHKAEIDKLYKKEETEELDEIHRMKTKLNTLDDISNKSVARQKLSNLMKSGKARGALIANKMRTLNMGEEVEIDETWSKEQLASIHSMHDKMSKSVGLDPTKKYGTIITKSKKDREMDKAIKDEMNEISNATLTSYKQKAGEQASAADKVGDFKKGNKRFSGIVKATKKQFANDLKKEDLDESRGHKIIATFFKNREAWNKTPIKPKDDSIKKASTAKAMDQAIKDQIKEDGEGGVAANNAGSGNVAGFAGDAGKKAVMTKKPLQRKTLADFRKFVSQEHEEN